MNEEDTCRQTTHLSAISRVHTAQDGGRPAIKRCTLTDRRIDNAYLLTRVVSIAFMQSSAWRRRRF